jgi:hypothetical protein
MESDVNTKLMMSKVWPTPVETGDPGQALGLELETL